MTRLSMRLLGQLQVLVDGEAVTGFESDKVRALLVYLAVEAGRLHRREALAGLLWPERPQGSALNNLRGALSNLRKAIHDHAASPPFILATRQTIQFNLQSDHWSDVSDLAALTTDDSIAESGAASLENAVSLYRGPFLEGFTLKDSVAFDEWSLLKREQIGRQISHAYQQLVTLHEQAGEVEQALGHAWRWAELETIDELVHRHVMRLLAASGQRSAALAHYEDLCRLLADELGVDPSEETQALHQAVLDGQLSDTLPPPADSEEGRSPPVELPVQATPFIGRQRELGQIADLLANPACRLLTLTGPGGVGKTRLALQAARDQSTSFSDGVFFVPLAPLTSSEFLVSAIAAALRFEFYGPDDPKVQLLNHLQDREVLLLLDGFDHLLAGAALVPEILEYAPHLKLMVTSRERLNLQGEWLVEVEGMAFPHEDVAEEIDRYDSIRLFMQSARRVRSGFTLTDVEMLVAARICRLMRGLPLGVELAASWLHALSAEQIVTEIEGGLEFLSSSLRDVPERHRSLSATFDYSWKLLSEEEQVAFRRLSVFRGGFDREAAGQIAGASLPVLSELVGKSLVRRSGSGRYEIHGLLRQYAGSQLLNAGEEEATHRRHRDWFLSLAERVAPDLWGAGDQAWLDQLRIERDNHRAALQWSMGHGDAEERLRLASALVWFWYVRSDFAEGRRWLDRALEAGEGGSAEIRAMVRARAGNLAIMARDYQRGVSLTEHSVQALTEVGNLREAGWQLQKLGVAAVQQGDFERAAERYAESIDLFRQIGYEPGVANILMYQGVTTCYQGDCKRAGALLEESLPMLREAGDDMAVAMALHGLGLVALNQKEFGRAEAFFKEGLPVAERIGARLELAQLLEGLAGASCQQGHYRQSCVLLGFSEQLRNTISTPRSIAEQPDYERCLSTIRSNLDDDALAKLWQQGQALSIEGAVAHALEDTSRATA